MEIKTDIKVLRAGYGDCIFIGLISDIGEFNILIDGGLRATYNNVYDRRNPVGPLKVLISDLKEQQRKIDLLILTHVDDDHVLGIKEWFENDFPTADFVRCFWVNDDMKIRITRNLNNSPANASSLLKLLRDNNFQYSNQIVKGVILENEFCTIKVISPSEVSHNQIAKNLSLLLNNAADNSYKTPLKDYLKKEWQCGTLTDENKASIAIEIETKSGERLLMLGDAEIQDVMKELKVIHKESEFPVEYSWIKLSHHCSKNNFYPDFLKLVHSRNYIISTNGSKFHHPDKDVIAYIVDQTNSNIYFNYPERARVVFTEQDYKDYPQLESRLKSF